MLPAKCRVFFFFLILTPPRHAVWCVEPDLWQWCPHLFLFFFCNSFHIFNRDLHLWRHTYHYLDHYYICILLYHYCINIIICALYIIIIHYLPVSQMIVWLEWILRRFGANTGTERAVPIVNFDTVNFRNHRNSQLKSWLEGQDVRQTLKTNEQTSSTLQQTQYGWLYLFINRTCMDRI